MRRRKGGILPQRSLNKSAATAPPRASRRCGCRRRRLTWRPDAEPGHGLHASWPSHPGPPLRLPVRSKDSCYYNTGDEGHVRSPQRREERRQARCISVVGRAVRMGDGADLDRQPRGLPGKTGSAPSAMWACACTWWSSWRLQTGSASSVCAKRTMQRSSVMPRL